ncbi:MAG TPA: hypothetical protein VF017_05575 [Thermoanaerobaculia bacterium]|nr:hypothetical protein [Thermoanaerobaculia bacterium]
MSAEVLTRDLPQPGTAALWARQIGAILRFELVRTLFSRRAILLYLAALAPVGLLLIWVLVVSTFESKQTLAWATSRFFPELYQGLILRTIVFFGSLWAFLNLFRGEVLDRSLHYYFLTPVRREVLVVGKYIAGVIATVALFGTTTLACYLLLYVPYGSEGIQNHLLGGPGLAQLLTYWSITVLGCIGYGAVALLLSLRLTNPILPAIFLYGWEWLHFLLPAALKKLSVVHYLKALSPVPISEGPLAIVSEPPPAWVSVGGLLVFAAVLLTLTCWLSRKMEIRYGDE